MALAHLEISIPPQTLFGFAKTPLTGVSEGCLHVLLGNGVHHAPRNLYLVGQLLQKPKINFEPWWTYGFSK